MSGKGYVVLGDIVELSIAHNYAVSLPLEFCDGMKQTNETQGRLPSSIKAFANMTLEKFVEVS
jgi:hypothetical protein